MSDYEVVREAICELSDDADECFDLVYPAEFRRFRRQHSTPVEVCARAAAWLAPHAGARVLDVGSGAGRFCITGALTTAGHFTGVEQRAWLVDAAREAARNLRATATEFVHGDIRSVDWSAFDGFYLFNPFGENILDGDDHIDHDVELSDSRYLRDLDAMEQTLRGAPIGTYFLLYNGFGGAIPGTYEEVQPDHTTPDLLCLWQRVR